MSDIVTAVSFAFKLVIAEDDSAEADMLKRAWHRQGRRVVVPCWFACEVRNALHQKVRSGLITERAAADFVRIALNRVTVLDPDPGIAVCGIQIASQLRQRASYDAQYLALAERHGCELWTADRRFALTAQPDFPFVHWLGQAA